jgi:hypothetical protein
MAPFHVGKFMENIYHEFYASPHDIPFKYSHIHLKIAASSQKFSKSIQISYAIFVFDFALCEIAKEEIK